MTNEIAVEKSLTEETKKVSRRCPWKPCEMIKNVIAIIFIRMNLIKNFGTNLQTGVSFCLF